MANKPLKSIKFPGLDDTYTVAVTDTTLSKSGDPADAKATGDALETKADKDGYYSDLTAGTAEQLLASQFVEDKVPYLFRTSGGSIDIGNRETDKIVGGSIVWNQLALIKNTTTINGITFTSNNDGTYTVSGTATDIARLSVSVTIGQHANPDHKYYVSGCPKNGSSNTYACEISFVGINSLDTGNGAIATVPDTQYTGALAIKIGSGVTVDNLLFKPQIIDLTMMFGSAIADYIYSLERASAGSGVAWFRNLFQNDYYPYNAGELKHVEGLSSHDMTGLNQWDEAWEAYGTNQIKAKNRIPLIPGKTYFCNFLGSMYFYEDLNSSNIGNVSFNNNTITIPDNAHYGIFYTGTSYGNVYKNDICINLSWSGYRDGEYEPYEKRSYPLDSSLTLRGIPKLDAENNLYYDGDEYASDGTVTRRYGIVDLGTLTWGMVDGSEHTFRAQTNEFTMATNSYNMICTKYSIVSTSAINDSSADMCIAYPSYGVAGLRVHDSTYSDATAFKTAMSDVYLVYELATSTTEEAEPYTNPQIVDDFGTEEYVTSSVVPVGHETMYPANLRDKLQHLPDLAENDGYYAIKQEGSQLSLELFRIPKAPTTDGNYTLKATVTGGVPTYTWESEGE